jgi:hypothetical protein
MDPLCRDCRDFGQDVKATHSIGKTNVCEKHYAERLGQGFKPKVEEVREVEEVEVVEEEAMAEKLCACGCGGAAMKGRFYKLGHKPKENGQKPAGGGKTARATNGATNGNGHFRVDLTLDGLNAIWNSLLPEKKAELLRAL